MSIEKQTQYTNLYDTISVDLYINYSFPLDSFQKSAIYSLHTKSEDILVTAHTSAGKTIIAEYAISVVLSTQASNNNSIESRIIYTSPIKSLSNQKFSDFRKLFGAENVGIITGDISINERAPCLIMTTEILRNMLYINHEMVPSIKTVIFDEVHYITDKSRGVVWEESMILLPKEVKLVLLSATMNNKQYFMDWIINIRKNTIFNASTYKRPVDLDFYIWFNNNNYLFKSTSNKLFTNDNNSSNNNTNNTTNSINNNNIKIHNNNNNNNNNDKSNNNKNNNNNDSDNNINKDDINNDIKIHSNYAQRCKSDEVLRKIESKLSNKHTQLSQTKSQNEMIKFLTFNFYQRKLSPLLIFCFSQKKVEKIASLIISSNQLTLTDKQTKKQIQTILEVVFSKLYNEDKELPQVDLVKQYLLNGIGIHHSGLLPILKEVTEMLFKWKLIQIIIATETFGMGVNYPAKTVIFDGLYKHDGTQLRGLTANECKQMCGRAGRRGKDSLGEIYAIYNKERRIDREVIKTAFFGNSEELESQFKVNYNMVLNTINKFGNNFSAFANQSLKQYELIKHYNNRNNKLKFINDTLNENKELLDFSKVYLDYLYTLKQFTYLFISSRYSLKYLTKGNLFITFDNDYLPVLGVVLECNKTNNIKVLYLNFPGKFKRIEDINENKDEIKEINNYIICNIKSKLIHCLIDKKIDIGDITHIQKINYRNIDTFVNTIKSDNNSDLKTLMFGNINVKKLKVKDIKIVLLNEQLIKINKKIWSHIILNKCNKFNDSFNLSTETTKNANNLLIGKIIEMEKDKNDLKKQLDIENTELNNDYIIKFNELVKLGYIENIEDPILTIKGRFSIILKSCENQVWLTELIFKGMFNELKEEEIVALISMFYYSKGDSILENFEFKQLNDENDNNIIINNNNNIEGEEVEENDINSLNIDIEAEKSVKEFIKKFIELLKETGINNLETGFKIGAINSVYWWMNKQNLGKIVEEFDINEGSLTRILNRINYLLEELEVACEMVIKNECLIRKFKKCRELLKRDIMFVESLYFDQGFDDIGI